MHRRTSVSAWNLGRTWDGSNVRADRFQLVSWQELALLRLRNCIATTVRNASHNNNQARKKIKNRSLSVAACNSPDSSAHLRLSRPLLESCDASGREHPGLLHLRTPRRASTQPCSRPRGRRPRHRRSCPAMRRDFGAMEIRSSRRLSRPRTRSRRRA